MEIPNEIMKKICLYRVFSPHPVAVLFKREFRGNGNFMYCDDWGVSFYDVWGGHKYHNQALKYYQQEHSMY